MERLGYTETKIVIRMNRDPRDSKGTRALSYDVFVISQGFKPLLYQNIEPGRLLRVLETVSFELPIEVNVDPMLDTDLHTYKG